MTFREDIHLPKPSNIACYLPKRDAVVLLTIMLEIDRIREEAKNERDSRAG